MQSVSPVFTKEETQFEYEIAKNQPEYLPVIGLPVTLKIIDPTNGASKEIPNWAIAVRFRLSEEERAQIAAGLDLVVTQLTFGKPLAPMNLQLCPAATKPIFEMRDEEPARVVEQETIERFSGKLVEMPASIPDATGLADICPSCGATERIRESQQRSVSGNACANAWHAAEDQPQSGV
jgi:hypothetical protein